VVWQDEAYQAAGATISDTRAAFGQDIVLKVRPPDLKKEVELLKTGTR
jgi:NAD/NADP transhydrogenase alpha subunit